jgi:hypothetical protein
MVVFLVSEVPPPTDASQELQREVRSAKTSGSIRSINVSKNDEGTALGVFIKKINPSLPGRFGVAVDELSKLDPEDHWIRNSQIGEAYVRPIIRLLEREAWDLCEKANDKPSLEDIDKYSWIDPEVKEKAEIAKRLLADPPTAKEGNIRARCRSGRSPTRDRDSNSDPNPYRQFLRPPKFIKIFCHQIPQTE